MRIDKRLEIGLKDGVSQLVRSLAEQPPRAPSPPYARLLFIRYGGVGDMILTLPVLRAARARFPEARINVVCDRANAGPLLDTGLADTIDYYDKRPSRTLQLIRRFRRRDHDCVVNLLPYPSFTFGMLARFGGPRALRIAGDAERFDYFYNRCIDLPPKREMHMLDRMFLVAADVVGDSPERPAAPWVGYGPEIRHQAEETLAAAAAGIGTSPESGRLALLNLAAGLERREWPLEKNVALVRGAIDQLGDRLDGWLVVTSPQAPDGATALVRAVDRPHVAALPRVPDFRVLMEIVRRAHLVVTPDTSIAHAASAMGTPVIDLMIGENVTTWAPIGVPHRVVASNDERRLQELPVDRVLGALGELLEELAVSRPAPGQ